MVAAAPVLGLLGDSLLRAPPLGLNAALWTVVLLARHLAHSSARHLTISCLWTRLPSHSQHEWRYRLALDAAQLHLSGVAHGWRVRWLRPDHVG